ncbi:EamA-like transporter family protein [Caprobacter fermentans]|uniref:EamA-like transporter family protein n=1 Tax=Caproicibacter fermentans TaxID=2576756 RepID=A0A6N8I1Z5_9FIRM|nr:DMT family transporter [Caproicibacter fermentans]MVB11938.1 EamA-like transporter family protein [Caproicibacter fermentans]
MRILRNRSVAAELGIVLVTMIWGSSFVVVKNATDTVPAATMIVLRFSIAAVFLCLFFFKKLKQINLFYIKWGFVIGLQNFAGYELQTVGVEYTTAGKNAFLTAVYCVIVPFLYWAVRKQQPRLFHLVSACMCITGVGLLSIQNGFSMNPGDLLSLACGLFFAMQIVTISILTEKHDPILICITQAFATVIFALPFAVWTEKIPTSLPAQSVFSLLYLGVIGTMLTTVLQTICQKYTPPAKASLIMSLESVFGTICGIVFLHESLTKRTFGGFLLIFIAMMLSEHGDRIFLSGKKLKTVK